MNWLEFICSDDQSAISRVGNFRLHLGKRGRITVKQVNTADFSTIGIEGFSILDGGVLVFPINDILYQDLEGVVNSSDTSKECICDSSELFSFGCVCGFVL